jgi:hypothetical protein
VGLSVSVAGALAVAALMSGLRPVSDFFPVDRDAVGCLDADPDPDPALGVDGDDRDHDVIADVDPLIRIPGKYEHLIPRRFDEKSDAS